MGFQKREQGLLWEIETPMPCSFMGCEFILSVWYGIPKQELMNISPEPLEGQMRQMQKPSVGLLSQALAQFLQKWAHTKKLQTTRRNKPPWDRKRVSLHAE